MATQYNRGLYLIAVHGLKVGVALFWGFNCMLTENKKKEHSTFTIYKTLIQINACPHG